MHDEFELDKLDDEMEIIAGILSPIAYGSLNIGDLISELDSSNFFTTDPDGLLLLTYQDSLLSYVAEDMLEIESQSFFEFFIKSEFAIPPLPVQDTFEIDRTTKFPFAFSNGEQLDSMILDEGNLIFDITSTFQHPAQINLIIPNLKLNGVLFSQTFDISDASGSYSETISFNIDNYTIYLQDSVDTDSMFFPVEFHVEVYTDGVHGIADTDQIVINATLDNLDFDAIFGYIGNYELLGQAGDLDIGFFDNPMEGTIEFENPQINFNISNSFGVPAEIDINRFTGFDENGDSVLMTFNAGVNPFEYAYPTLAEYGEVKDTVLSINGSNSSISEFLTTLPSRIEYSVSAASNPDNDTSIYNFVDDNSKIDVSFEFILPLWFKADNFAFSDTLEDILEAGWNEDADIIDQISIMLEVSNGMPIDIDFQITFMDSIYNPVDTLFAEGSQPVISAANIDPVTYDVTSTSIKTSLIQYINADIERIKNARHAIIRAGLKTPTVDENPVPVKFFDTYTVDFNLSVGVNIKANTNDF